MPDQLAIKRLTASDLTFFEWHFRNRNAGNQKAINLNANVFIDEMFPGLPALAEQIGGRFGVDLYLYGPGLGASEQNLQRKIVKIGTYKNWRLNGEFISAPIGEEDRYNVLAPGDLAIVEFSGEARPESARIVFVSKNLPDDVDLWRVLGAGDYKMATLELARLQAAVVACGPALEHPIRVLLSREELREAAQGGETLLSAAARRGPIRTITREELQQARRSAEAIGEEGEALVNAWLESEQLGTRIVSFSWVAQSNAAAPYDFSIMAAAETEKHVDVKTTSGEFERAFHLSTGELLHAAGSDTAYHIYRVARVRTGEPEFAASAPINSWCRELVDLLARFPEGIRPDGLVVEPGALTFGERTPLPGAAELDDGDAAM